MKKMSLTAFAVTFVSVVFAGTSVWKGGNDGGWANEDNWASGGVPGAGDTVEVPASTDLPVVDSDASLVSAIGAITLTAADSTVTFDVSKDVTITVNGTITGNGKIIKNGEGTVQTWSHTKDGYWAKAGIDVNAGDFKYPSDFSTSYSSEIMNVGDVFVAEGATLHVYCPQRRTSVGNLLGKGKITADVAGGKWYVLVTPSVKPCTFEGSVHGYIRLDIRDSLNLPNEKNYYRGPTEINDGTGKTVVGFNTLGHRSDGVYTSSSSLGSVWYSGTSANPMMFSSLGTYRFLGDGAVDSDRPIEVSGLGGALDAGFGSWTVNSDISFAAAKQLLFTLCSSNTTTASVLNGTWSEPANNSVYLAKTGPGIWSVTGSDKRVNKGTVGVEAGTLRFDTLASKGEPCSFGLSTLTAEKHTGDWDGLKASDYAILLGGADAVGTIEYVGDGHYDNATTNRPIAVTGCGGRILADKRVGFKGAFSADANGSTLILDGASPGSCLYDVTDGKGPMSVRKTGTGTWNLGGELSFRGNLDVDAGTLVVSSTLGHEYRWYRFTIRETFAAEMFPDKTAKNLTNNDVMMRIREMAIYDADGNRLNSGFTYTSAADDVAVGQYAIWNPTYQYDSGADRLCDELADKSFICRAAPDGHLHPSYDDWRESWGPIVTRVAPGTAQAVSYDLVVGESSGHQWSTSIVAMEASADGIFWDFVSKENVSKTVKASMWAGDGSTFVKNAKRQGGYVFGMDNGKSLYTSVKPQLEHATVSVASGATLRGEGDVTVRKLRVDPALGNGMVTGFKLAAGGSIEVTGNPEGQTFSAAVDLSGCTDLENIEGWSVSIGGRPCRGCTVSYADGRLMFQRPGFSIILR